MSTEVCEVMRETHLKMLPALFPHDMNCLFQASRDIQHFMFTCWLKGHDLFFDIANKKADGARNTSSQTIIQVLDKLEVFMGPKFWT